MDKKRKVVIDNPGSAPCDCYIIDEWDNNYHMSCYCGNRDDAEEMAWWCTTKELWDKGEPFDG